MSQRDTSRESGRSECDEVSITSRGRRVRSWLEGLTLPRLLWSSLGVYALVALWAYAPLWPGDPHAIMNCVCGDNVQAPWFLGYVPWAILHGHNPFFTTYLDYPRGANLVTNTSVPLLGVLAAPVTELFGAIASFNLLMFLAFPLSGVSAAYVIAKWTRSNAAAFVGGLFYAFSPYVAHRAYEHLDLTFVVVPPLILYALFRVVVRQSGRPGRWGLGLGLLVVAQCGIDTEIAVSTLLVGAVGIVLCLVGSTRHAVRERIAFARRALVSAAALVSAVMAYPLAFQYLGPDGLRVPVQNPVANPYHSDLLGLVIPTSDERVAPSFLSHLARRFPTGPLENSSYLGIFTVVLVVLVVVRCRRSRAIRLSSALAAFSWLMTLGPRLVVAGHVTSVPLPFDVVAHLPVLDNMLPARWSLFEMFFVALTLAHGLALWGDPIVATRRRDQVSRPPWVTRSRALILTLLVGASFVSLVPAWPIPSVSTKGAVPAFFTSDAAKVIASGSTILTYPYVIDDYRVDDGQDAMLWQLATNFRWRVMGGYFLRVGPAGSVTAKPWPTPPLDVAAFLENWQSPVHSLLPSLVVTPALVRDVRTFVTRYAISAVVVARAAPGAPAVTRLFTMALGSARDVGGVALWTGRGRPAK